MVFCYNNDVMSIRSDKLHLSHLVTHETKRRALLKFALVVALFAGYFGVIAYRYGVKEGIFVTAGTWSFAAVGRSL